MPDLFPYIAAIVIGAIGYLLQRKDTQQEETIKKQEESIKLLFLKHDEDAKALQELKLQIAESHYKKTELDYKFNQLEVAITTSFNLLGTKFDKLSDALLDHIQKEDKK